MLLHTTAGSLNPHLLVPNGVVPEDAFRVIDEEVKRHRDLILSLKTRRNEFASISKLPPELLSHIFCFVRDDCSLGCLSWIKVTHLCRAWRNVALNHPSLWSKPPIAHRQWTAEMLSRSKNASLTVEVHYPMLTYPPMAHERVSSVLIHSSRIRHLTLKNVDRIPMQKFLSEMPKQTPRLEILSLSIRRGTLGQPGAEISELPSEFISTTDRLRHLELTGLKFDWNAILSESLTHLSLHDIPSPTGKQFWDALKRMPLLESLKLVNALPDSRSLDDHDLCGGILHLSHLRSLTITSSTPDVESFLKGISCPALVTITIDSKGAGAILQNFEGVISWLSTALSPFKKPRGSIRTLEILATSPGHGLRFRASPEIHSSDISMPSPLLDLSLSFPVHPDQDSEVIYDKMLADVSGAVALQGLVSLRLEQQASLLSARTLTETFGSLTQLRSVTAVGFTSVNLVKALNDTLPNKRLTRSKHAKRPTFPVLRSISIFCADFEFDLTFRDLEDMVKNRKKRRAEVRELSLQECSRVHQDDVVELKKIVPNFSWDGIEIGNSDEEEFYSDYYGHVPYDYDSDDSFYLRLSFLAPMYPVVISS